MTRIIVRMLKLLLANISIGSELSWTYKVEDDLNIRIIQKLNLKVQKNSPQTIKFEGI